MATPSNPLPCGCKVAYLTMKIDGMSRDVGAYVVHCPLHAAAEELLECAKAIELDARGQTGDELTHDIDRCLLDDLYEAIAKAKQK